MWTPPAGAPPVRSAAPAVAPEELKARERTITGLSFLIFAFILGWIPYVNYLGELLGLIGIIFLFLGRWGFGPRHHSFVVGGAALLLLVLIVSFVAGLVFVSYVVSDSMSTSSQSQLSSALQGQVDALFIATAVLGILSGLAYVLMPYGLAEGGIRSLLWLALVAQVVVYVLVLATMLPRVNSAIAQATSGPSIDLGPINSLQTTALLLGMINVVPSMMFAVAYYWTRRRTIALS